MNNLNHAYKDHIYVMFSTLNQMVNYIPLKHYDFKEIYNITVTESDFASNKKWDKNLHEILKSEGFAFNIESDERNLKIEQGKVSDIEHILDILKANFGDQKIFWNITGGQRPFILAITQFIQNRQDDIICYLEGNKSQMALLKNNHKIEGMQNYNLKDLSIETALRLMGFDLRGIDAKNGKDDERKFYFDLYDKYIDKNNQILRTELVKLNQTKKPDCSSIANLQLKEMKFCEYTKEDFTKQYPFGYILEKLAFYQLEKIASNDIAAIAHSVKIIFDDKGLQKEIDNKTIDEFDIALLTKNGKFMIFECKSGVMDGDVAKSTKYSTYAVSGAYGLPILITPLLASEIGSIDSLGDEYKYIKSAVKSAKRANLEVWGIDELKTKLDKYIM